MTDGVFNKTLHATEILDILHEIKKNNFGMLIGTKPFPVLKCVKCGAICDIRGPSMAEISYSMLEKLMGNKLEVSPERFIRAARNYSVNSAIPCKKCNSMTINSELVILNKDPIPIAVEYRKHEATGPILFPLSRAELTRLLPNPGNIKKDKPPRPHLTYHVLRSNIDKDKKFIVNIDLYTSFDNRTIVISQCKFCQHKAKINLPIKDLKRWLNISKERANSDDIPNNMPAVRLIGTDNSASKRADSNPYYK